MGDIVEQAEQQINFRQKSNNNPQLMFNALYSAGYNPKKLAQICSAFDMFISIMGWQEKDLATWTTKLLHYQASIDGKYHNDYKDVLVAEEIERKRAERKGISILQQ